MKAQRFGITVVAVASVAVAIGAGAAATGTTPPWLDALNARSDALNRQHHLGDYAERRALGAPGPNWLQALQARSEAMNRYYGLGEYARQGARRSASTRPGRTARRCVGRGRRDREPDSEQQPGGRA
jgi:hypothetical protein